MLELKKIKKDYPAGGETVHALRGVDLKFRKNEFVAVLGPSGCGKTTLLNIVGGLDKYTDGDLVINGRSTKDFKDRDWDAYRNHSIGFVFQSYNLIPHQTVLRNVELALTISGVGKSERRERAKQALKDVGLESQMYKRPSEMSGGQMQRVAIARALVNSPDIILADEPTGALDTVTSVQVMEILKEISKDKLIIMVTHNPELAEKYASRTVRILDGEITEDTNPLSDNEYKEESEKDKKLLETASKSKKPSMSFPTAFSLSLRNLLTKKGRTMLTSFAGSIGIIGIALVLALSNGISLYIDAVQEETLSAYPLTIESTVVDFSTLMETFMGINTSGIEHEKDAVYTKPLTYDLINAMTDAETTENDLKAFKEYLDAETSDEDSDLYEAVSGIQYSYGLDLLVYTEDSDGKIIRSDSQDVLMDLLSSVMGMDMSAMMSARDSAVSGSSLLSMFSSSSYSISMWEEMLSGNDGSLISDMLKEQYDLAYGEWPTAYNEVVLVLDENNELDDLTLYALGLESEDVIQELIDAALNGKNVSTDIKSWSYEEICDKEYKIILNSDCYGYDEAEGVYVDLRDTDTGMSYLYDNGIDLKITGIIRPNEDASSTMLTGSIAYTTALTDYVVEQANGSDALNAQLADEETDIFTGLPFQTDEDEMTDEETAAAFRENAAAMTSSEKADAYVKIMSVPTDEIIAQTIEQTIGGMSREDMETMLLQSISEEITMDEDTLTEYVSGMSDDEFEEMVEQLITEQLSAQYAEQVSAELSSLSADELAGAFDAALETYTDEQCVEYYELVMPQEYSDSTYEDNLTALGYVELDNPTAINIFSSTFENKDVIAEAIEEYNDSVDELQEITYTDYIALMMSSITTIINAITYALIAFVAISLIVSSIMIGVITLISVQERTKEIGILRAIGASKKNVSRMFNAETIIIGFASGLTGIVVTYLLCIPINVIIHKLTDINNLSAQLPIAAAVILIIISMLLTVIAGLIPSRSAAKKDPVVALRTE